MARKSDELSSRILRHVSDKQYRPQKIGRLARSMGIEHGEYSAFRAAVKELMKAGRVVLGGGNQVMLPDAAGVIIGRFRGHERGFGFVVPESLTEHGDLFIPPGASLNAITGDTVAARITRRGKAGDFSRVEGEIVEVVERGQSRFVGELVRHGRDWIVLPDGNALHSPIAIGDPSARGAREGDQVVVELTQFPSADVQGRGVIVEVLGRRGEPGIDTISIIRHYHLPEGFLEPVLEDARRAVREYDPQQVLRRREDLRGETIITIDPDDARDFDDAISIRRAGGGFELGVHIADVSHFVRPGRPLDGEAAHRGNSVYLPQRVIPMLPETLSNGLCSLQEGEPRLCKTAFIQYDKNGHRRQTRFANTVIQSTRRLTYREATRILDGAAAGYPEPVVQLLRDMDSLARLIQKRRCGQGMIVLDLPEVELVLNEDGEVTGVEPTDTGFPHTIIEMFMVEANEVVAELFTGVDVPHLRRIHPDPPPDSRTKLARLLRVLGKKLPETAERRELIRLLESVKGRPEAFAVNLAVLRSMAPAEYSPRRVGHFALAGKAYSHFTSPIRRYPDLLIHRLLDEHLAGRLKVRKHRASLPSEETLVEVGKHCSYTERRAEDAERELRMVKILQFLSTRLGEVGSGVVTGVTNVGLFVQLRRYLVDGLVRFDDLADDWWDLDPRGGCMIGQRSGRRIKIGDPLQVQIAAVDIATRKLDLALAGDAPEAAGESSQRPRARQHESKPAAATPTPRRHDRHRRASPRGRQRSQRRGGGRR
ncbi:MAG: ribonuclease R [Planctomycetes bacterium]|nr:ribonuclease R [Planctomycetota bacterium]